MTLSAALSNHVGLLHLIMIAIVLVSFAGITSEIIHQFKPRKD